MMKNAFYFTLKAFFVLKIFKFLFWRFSWVDQVNFKIFDSQPGEKTIVIHILPNISRNKGNQTIRFGQLMEYNMRDILLEKPYTKFGGEAIPDLFLKNQN